MEATALRPVRHVSTVRSPKPVSHALARCIKSPDEQLVHTPRPPTCIDEVDNGKLLGFGADLAADHPGFHDQPYKERRAWIAELASSHRIGDVIPRIEYTAEEHATWATVLRNLRSLYPQHACAEYTAAFEGFAFQEDTVPQLQDVHELLQASTGWSVRPVAGLMHPRDFLNGLAFKYFHSTQYIRHSSSPTYTPEPDLVHEVLGHVPMLTNPGFCEMVQAIGEASLGASEKEIWHLTKVYWYTVEFGVVHQGAEVKAFGAGILSSFGELSWLGSGEAKVDPLDPRRPLPKMSYKDGFQKQYFSLESFDQGADLLKTYSRELQQGHSGA